MNLSIGTKVTHPKFGDGVIIENEHDAVYEIYFRDEGTEKEISKSFDGLVIVKLTDKDENAVSLDKVRETLEQIIEPLIAPSKEIELGDRWQGGTVTITPGRDGLQSKEIPIDSLWHKIVMTRDRLRVMEQKINASNITEAKKIELQQYITRIYGTFTTFNVLFENKEDHFKGTGSQ